MKNTTAIYDSKIQRLYQKEGLSVLKIAKEINQTIEFVNRRIVVLGLYFKEFN